MLKKKGLGEADIKNLPRSYTRQRCRHSIPDPKTLESDFEAVYALFSKITDPKSNHSFFTADARQRFNTGIGYIRAGLLSDPPGMNMYAETRVSRRAAVVPLLTHFVVGRGLPPSFVPLHCRKCQKRWL